MVRLSLNYGLGAFLVAQLNALMYKRLRLVLTKGTRVLNPSINRQSVV